MLHTSNPIIKHKAGLLNLAEELGNVSRACKVMGVSRDTFYRYQELVETGGIDALINQSRRTPNLKNRVDSETEHGVRSIWLRNDLENFKKRLIALERLVAENGIILTDEQVAALERKKHDDKACGEIETAHPGYLGSQDTFYVGTLKVLDASISRRSLIPIAKWLSLSSTQPKHQSQQQICSMIKSYRSSRLTRYLCSES